MLCSESELNLSEESEGIIELKNKEDEDRKKLFFKSGQKRLSIYLLLQIEQIVWDQRNC